jgi:hypothetical protein
MKGLRYILKSGAINETHTPGVEIELQVEDDPQVFRAAMKAEDAVTFANNIIQSARQALARCPPSSKRKQ